jgi:hypothetical protein
MKKINFAVLTVLGLGISSAALAAPTNVSGSTVITTGDCVLLGEQVTLNLSANVTGAYQCTDADQTIVIGTCHASGSRKPLDVQCTAVPDTDPAEFEPAGCPDAEPGTKVTISNYRAYTASSRGGSVTAQELGGNCTAATLNGLEVW